MTKNRKAKQAARTLAEHAEVNYTEARRREAPGHDASGSSVQAAIKGIMSLQAMVATAPSSDAAWTQDEPTFARRVRTDLDWADVVLDGRRGYDATSDPAPARFTYDLRPADARGRFEITAGPAAGVLVEGYAMGADEHGAPTIPAGDLDALSEAMAESMLGGKPGVVVRVTYPDGLRVGYLSYHFGDYDASAQEVWQSYVDRPLDGFGWALGSVLGSGQQVRRVHSYDEDLASADHHRAVQIGATRLRAALERPERWFSGKAPAAPEPGANAIGDLWWLATSGFVTRDDATPFLDRWHEWDFLPAQDGGFDLADPDDRAWLVDAGAGEWSYDHEDGWAGVARQRALGWTRGALSIVHERLREQQSAHHDAGRAAVEAAGIRETTQEREARYASAPRWPESEAPEWVRLTGTPAEASRRIEAGDPLPR